MATIVPFKAVRYNPLKVDDLSAVVTPPYDVISIEAQKAYYARHLYNVIRIILGEQLGTDTERNNKYTRSKKYLHQWINEGVLMQEPKPAIYPYIQRYLYLGKERVRRGFFALLKLAEFGEEGGIFPHEITLSKPKADRLNLLRTTRTHTEPIFVLYDDSKGEIEKCLTPSRCKESVITLKDETGDYHQVWIVDDEKVIKGITETMSASSIFIADGHHRYETALRFKTELSLSPNSRLRCDYILTYFVNAEDEGLTILPAHRLIRRISIRGRGAFLNALGPFFTIEQCVTLPAIFARLGGEILDNHLFGMYLGDKKFYLLTLKDKEKLLSIVSPQHSKEYNSLAVTILHKVIIEHILRLDDEQIEREISYMMDALKAVDVVDSGEYEGAFFLNPTKVSQVKEIARMGEKMPGKATYFYPKPLSGLIMSQLG